MRTCATEQWCASIGKYIGAEYYRVCGKSAWVWECDLESSLLRLMEDYSQQLPVVSGVSPNEGPPGTRLTIRGENLGMSKSDIIGKCQQ